MKIRFEKCDPNIRNELRAAMEFYAQKLFTPRMLDCLDFRVQFVPGMMKSQKLRGEIYPYVDGRNIRRFRIRIADDISKRNKLLTLAHEMAHAKQYALGEMREIGQRWTRWKDKKIIDDDVNYWERPWEIDARGWETGLYAQWRLTKPAINI